jgi:hypothetical protein
VGPLQRRIRSSVDGTRASENSFVGARVGDAGSVKLRNAVERHGAARALVVSVEKHGHEPSEQG